RPGEKLYEELFHESEALQSTTHEKILLARHRTVDWDWLDTTMNELNSACEAYDEVGLQRLFKALVPEWGQNEADAGKDLMAIPIDEKESGREEQPTLH
ncbi:hypothetical protein MNBD_GAMMA13-492, partial [hydrothermal vent metagenome]